MGLRQLLKRVHRALTTRRHAPMTPEHLGALVLRDATPADLPKLAQLHVDTFNETHVGPFGSGPTYAVREWQWREKLAELHATNVVLVIEAPGGELVGFCWVHPTSENPRFAARLNKIYLRRPYQRQGLGHAMVKQAVSRLIANGLTSMVLFTEPENTPACRFYDRLGGERQVGDDGTWTGMYGWPDLRVLQQSLARIDEEICIGCTKCIQACPVDAIVGASKLMHTVLVDECTGCELCIAPCPVDCIAMVPAPNVGTASALAPRYRARYLARAQRLQRWDDERSAELAARKATVDAGASAVQAAIARARARKSGGGGA